MRLGRVFCVMAILPALFSCASFQKPKDGDDCMILGRMFFEANNYEPYQSATINGKHQNVEITLRSVQSNREYTISSDYDTGVFSLSGIKDGMYQVSRYYYKKTAANNAYVYISFVPTSQNTLIVKKGKINNLGTIYWMADKQVGQFHNVNKEYEDTKKVATLMSGMENWANFGWIDIQLE